MIKQNSNLMVAAFFDRLLDQQASQASAGDLYLQQMQILCGRWLALRRLSLGLPLDRLAEAARIAPQSILFVETGLAYQDLEPDADWDRYAYLLSTLRDRIWVKRVLAIALGRTKTPSERMMIRVMADLNAAYTVRPPTPLSHKGQAHSAAPAPWTLVLRWIYKKLRPSGAVPAPAITLSVADPEAATFLQLAQIDPRMVADVEISGRVAAPHNTSDTLLLSLGHYLTSESRPALRDAGTPEPSAAVVPAAMPRLDLGPDIRGYAEALLGTLDRLVQPIGAGGTYITERLIGLTTDGPPQLLRRFERSSAAAPGDGCATIELSRPEMAEEAVARSPRLVLLGEPGSGKSTVARDLARRLAQGMLDLGAPLPKGWDAPKIPLICSLDKLSSAVDGRAPRDDNELLQCLIAPNSPANEPAYSGQQLRQALLRGEGLLLLDGLDGVSAAPGPDGRSPRAQLAAAIKMLGRALPQMTQIVVTCSSRVYKQSPRGHGNDWRLAPGDGWQQRTLQPYTSEQMRSMLQRGLSWPATLAMSTFGKPNGPAALLDRIQGDGLVRLYSSPLALTLLLALLANEQLIELPAARASLYDRFITMMLHKTLDGAAPPLSLVASPSADQSTAAVCRVALQASAFEALRLGAPAEMLRQHFPQVSLQSFLAACHLAITANLEQRAYMLWQGADGERWREALLLAAERLRQLGLVADRLVPWLARLVAPTAPDGSGKTSRQRQHDALLAADSYVAVGGRSGLALIADEELAQFEHTLADALAGVLAPLPLADEVDRFSAGAHLAALGDRRPGVATLEPVWCSMQTDRPAPRIARYLVTNTQWQRFIEEDGYTTPAWWCAGWARCVTESWAQPRFWDVPEHNQPNQPVVGVSWYEACAFCRWLTRQGRAAGWLSDDEHVRLPTVAEWQYAAYGADGRPYPWGDTWDAGSANTAEAGLGGPLPVGCYPHGASPCGALDMAGNVAEWCDPDPAAPDRLPFRCGGSWAEDQLVVRRGVVRTCAPDTRGNLLGLRVIAARSSR
jgi:hypothetical protein